MSAKNIKGGKIVNHDQIRFLDNDLYKKWMKDELQAGDVLMTSEAPMGELYFLARDKKYCLSQRIYALRNSGSISPSYLYCWLQSDNAKADLESRCTGTTVIGIKQAELRQVQIVIPKKSVVEEFERRVRPLFNKVYDLQEDTVHLAKLRDTLLPKLVSGEVRVLEEMINFIE